MVQTPNSFEMRCDKSTNSSSTCKVTELWINNQQNCSDRWRLSFPTNTGKCTWLSDLIYFFCNWNQTEFLILRMQCWVTHHSPRNPQTSFVTLFINTNLKGTRVIRGLTVVKVSRMPSHVDFKKLELEPNLIGFIRVMTVTTFATVTFVKMS